MKFFRSTPYHLLLGALMAVSVFICFATPIGGSFNDVVTLKKNNVTNVTPVKMTIMTTGYDSVEKKFYHGRDRFDTVKRVLINRTLDPKIGDIVVAECSYIPAGDFYEAVRVERVNPSITFPLIQGLGELGRNMLFHVPM